ncbi:MAG: Gfo/Idh/MocA family oxidoreductase [Clostridia bacterium]|nr:Gfo/Idh/MocA family oxidoreductase [Clostridia bacterium]
MNKVRVAIIGIGNMGSAHAKHIFSGDVKDMELAAICDIDSGKLAWAAENLPGVPQYSNYHELLDAHICDAIIIATPHYDHPVIAIEGFEKGYHVLSEKPAGVYTKKVREMNAAAEKSGKAFALMFNQRTNPLYQKVREMVQDGTIGEPKRLVWIITDWYRTQAYYDSGAWRATWAGEGGGVLLNQCPHNLDLWQWIFGMPKSITAKCSVGKYHDIEVEDDVTITASYENGASACFITTTGEFPGTNRLEISGDRGKVVIENKKLTFYRLETPERVVNATSTKGFDSIPFTVEETVIESKSTAHVGILQNFTNHILYGEELLSSGYEGINALTISNAAFLSDWLGQEITLPMDEDLFYKLLSERIKTSRHKEVTASSTIEDLSGTYNARWQGNP